MRGLRNTVNGDVDVRHGQTCRTADAVGFFLGVGDRVAFVVIEIDAGAISVRGDLFAVDNKDVAARLKNRLIELGSIVPQNDGEPVVRHGDGGRAVVVRSYLAAGEGDISRHRLGVVIELTTVNTAEIGVVLSEIGPGNHEGAVKVGGDRRIDLRTVQ